MIDALVLYAAAMTGLSAPDFPLDVQTKTPEEACLIVLNRPCDPDFNERILGAYINGTGLLILNEEVNLDEPFGESILLHEIVHYLQDTAEVGRYTCHGDKEREAYWVQEEWMAEKHDVDIYEEHLNGLFTVMQFMIGCEDHHVWRPGK